MIKWVPANGLTDVYLLIATVQTNSGRKSAVGLQLGHLLGYGHSNARDVGINVALGCAKVEGNGKNNQQQ